MVPKGAIFSVADALQKSIERGIREESPLAWGKLFSFCFWGLRQPTGKHEDAGSVSLATHVRRQVSSFMEVDSLITPESSVRVWRNSSGDAELGKRVSIKMSEGDTKGAVRLLSSALGVATPE